MYRFSSADRDYTSWTASDSKTGNKLSVQNFVPINHKLFNFDMFSYINGKVTISNSPTRRGSIAGVLVLEGKKTYGKYKRKFLYKCIPDDRRLPIFLVPYSIKPSFSKAYKNRYVIIYFKNWSGKHPEGFIDQNIGQVNDLSSFYQYQLYCRSLNASIQNFTKSARKELKKRPESELVDLIIEKYSVVDRRSQDIVTIDPRDSKDFDDAFGLEKTEVGYTLSIYIANVPLWLDFLELWQSFSSRIATIYLPDRKLPMLPTILSDVLCSLQEGCSRFALALDIYMDHDYTIQKCELVSTVIRISKNLRYDTKELAKNVLYRTTFPIISDMNKKRAYVDNIKTCHDVVAYMMIVMNHYCAQQMFKNNIGIYRSMTYNSPDVSCMIQDNDVKNFLKGWHSTGGNYSKISDTIKHDALNLEQYIHITSPIRRLVDLLNMVEIQSILKLTNLTKQSTEFHASWTTDERLEFINTTMRSIRKIQNECNLLYMCTNSPDILSKKHNGFIFDKMKKTDGMFQYHVYLTNLKMVRKTISSTEVDINNYYKFELYLFMDQIQLYKKVRILLCI